MLPFSGLAVSLFLKPLQEIRNQNAVKCPHKGNLRPKDANHKRKMAFLETGEISVSPVDVKVDVCYKILSDKRMENECHLILCSI